jgi:hypothetical protein
MGKLVIWPPPPAAVYQTEEGYYILGVALPVWALLVVGTGVVLVQRRRR